MTIDDAIKNCEYGLTFTDKEYNQIAEWLEELKAYKEKEFDVLKQDGQLLYKQGVLDGYDKAIEEQIQYDCPKDTHDIEKIAERLKVGEVNDRTGINRFRQADRRCKSISKGKGYTC